MDLTTNEVIVNYALRFIQSKMEKLDTIHTLDVKNIETFEGEATGNGVF